MPAGWLVMPVPAPLLPSNWSDFSGWYSIQPALSAGHAEGAAGPGSLASAVVVLSAVGAASAALTRASGETRGAAVSAGGTMAAASVPPAPLPPLPGPAASAVTGGVTGDPGSLMPPSVDVGPLDGEPVAPQARNASASATGRKG